MAVSFAAALRVQSMIFSGLIAGLGIYGLIAHQLAMQPGGTPLAPAILYALAAVALMETALIPLLRRRLLPATAPGAQFDAAPESIDAAGERALAKLHSAQIITWAVCESMALYGLALVFMAHDMRYYFAFAALSAGNFLIYRPSAELMTSVLRAARP